MARTFSISLVVGIGVLTGTVDGQVTYEIIGECMPTDVSADGSVLAGNMNGTFETCRWTTETGIVQLGQPSLAVGSAAGGPQVSADGTKVSATIADASVTFVTQGRWTLGSGWQECMPPTLPDGGLLDNAYGSAWGISDDGDCVVGLYWRPGGAADGVAHASVWTEATGIVDLGSSGNDSRANDANYDCSVIVGWDAAPFGYWRPAVWVDGVMTILADYEEWTQASAVTPDGTVVVGQAYDEVADVLPAASWRWNGSNWDQQVLGVLPGTFHGLGLAIANDVTADGSMVVGYNAFDGSPFNASGFIWTAAGGMIDVDDYLAANGIPSSPTFDRQSLTGVSDDGTVMVGIGKDVNFPFTQRGFVISVPIPCPADIDESGEVDPADLALLLGSWGQEPTSPANLNGDSVVDALDLAILLGAWAPVRDLGPTRQLIGAKAGN